MYGPHLLKLVTQPSLRDLVFNTQGTMKLDECCVCNWLQQMMGLMDSVPWTVDSYLLVLVLLFLVYYIYDKHPLHEPPHSVGFR